MRIILIAVLCIALFSCENGLSNNQEKVNLELNSKKSACTVHDHTVHPMIPHPHKPNYVFTHTVKIPYRAGNGEVMYAVGTSISSCENAHLNATSMLAGPMIGTTPPCTHSYEYLY